MVVDVQNREKKCRREATAHYYSYRATGQMSLPTSCSFSSWSINSRFPHYRILESWRRMGHPLSSYPALLPSSEILPRIPLTSWPLLQHLQKCGAQYFCLKSFPPFSACSTSTHHSIFKSGAQFLWGPCGTVIGASECGLRGQKDLGSILPLLLTLAVWS